MFLYSISIYKKNMVWYEKNFSRDLLHTTSLVLAKVEATVNPFASKKKKQSNLT